MVFLNVKNDKCYECYKMWVRPLGANLNGMKRKEKSGRVRMGFSKAAQPHLNL